MSSPEKTPLASNPDPESPTHFKDEPKAESSPQDAAFVDDKGDGTASLMKPRKPTRHHRARDSHYDIEGKKVVVGQALEEESCDTDSTLIQFKESKWAIVSATVFVISSILYLAMACMIMDVYWWYKDVPRAVQWADDDSTWWNYLINCTDDGFIPEHVYNATDDWTWVDWYNNSAFPEDDNIWVPKIANADAPFPEPYVSKYMILYFLAAFGFLITGVIEIVLARKSPFRVQVLYYLMMLAAMFGLASAILTNKSPNWSNICNCASTNLWALEAAFIVAQRLYGTGDFAEYDNVQTICNLSIKTWLWVADISFLIGTLGDAITSWLYVFQYDNYILGFLAIVFALAWLICAFVYLAVAIYDWNQYKTYFDLANEYEKEINAMPKGVILNVGDLKKTAGGNSDGSKEGISKKDITQNTTTGSAPTSSNNSANDSGGPVTRSSTGDLADEGCCPIPVSD